MTTKQSNPKHVLKQLSTCIEKGTIKDAMTHLESYILHSPKYTSKERFATAIGTNRQTLYRMLLNENVSMNLFFDAVNQIHKDSKEV